MKIENRTVLAIAGLIGAAALLSACSQDKDLWVVNTCGQAVTVGFEGSEDSPLNEWYPVDDGTTLELSVGGYSSVLLTILQADAEQVSDPAEVDLGDLEWVGRPTAGDYAEVDLAAAGLCP